VDYTSTKKVDDGSNRKNKKIVLTLSSL
jgi:hypothetical protein